MPAGLVCAPCGPKGITGSSLSNNYAHALGRLVRRIRRPLHIPDLSPNHSGCGRAFHCELLPLFGGDIFRSDSWLCAGRLRGGVARSKIYNLALICFNRGLRNTVRTLPIAFTNYDVRRDNGFLCLPRLHCDLHLHPRNLSHRDSRDRNGDRVCMGTSWSCNHAPGLWTFLCNSPQIDIVLYHRPCSHSCRICGPLLWSINSRQTPPRGDRI